MLRKTALSMIIVVLICLFCGCASKALEVDQVETLGCASGKYGMSYVRANGKAYQLTSRYYKYDKLSKAESYLEDNNFVGIGAVISSEANYVPENDFEASLLCVGTKLYYNEELDMVAALDETEMKVLLFESLGERKVIRAD